MKTIKIIDLLNKIANGEEIPKKIKYLRYEYEFNEEEKEYQRYYNKFNYGLGEDRRLDIILDDEIEILEEEKEILEKLSILTFSDLIDMPKEDLVDVILEQRVKINEILDYLESKRDE